MGTDPRRKLKQNPLLLRRNASMPSITRDAAVPRYVMIPKTGTTALADFMNGCMHGRVSPRQVLDEVDGTIIHKHIGPLSRHEHIVATLRDPVKRFSSLLNYREQKGKAQDKWLEMGLPLNANLSVVIDILTDEQMLQFSPYLTQSTYVTDCTVYTCSVLETRDYFEKRMGFSGCAPLPHSNAKQYSHGLPRPDQEARIRRVFAADQRMWDRHCADGKPRVWDASCPSLYLQNNQRIVMVVAAWLGVAAVVLAAAVVVLVFGGTPKCVRRCWWRAVPTSQLQSVGPETCERGRERAWRDAAVRIVRDLKSSLSQKQGW